MKTAYERLNEIISDGEKLLQDDITNSSTEFTAWKLKAERFLISQFGEDSHEYKSFSKIEYHTFLGLSAVHNDWVDACHNGIKKAIAVFNVLLEDFPDNKVGELKQPIIQDYKRVFIVHGHDGELKESVARIIEKQGIEAIILSEKTNRGKTIIEKFENYSDVGGAICLFTADDIGRANAETSDHTRARQNVVFETGYFIGKLTRGNIVILADEGIEMPSDLSGVVHTNTGYWQVELLKELKDMGYSVDLNLLL